MTKTRNICIVGPSKSFLSGISYYTVRLANALSESNNVSVVTIEKLVPEFLFPGRKRVGKRLSELELSDDVSVLGRVDYDSPSSWFDAFRSLEKHDVEIIILQWWTASVAHIYFALIILNKIAPKAKVIIEFHELIDQIEESSLPIKIYSQLMGRLITKETDAYVAHSPTEKSKLTERYGVSLKKTYMVPHALFDQYRPMDMVEAKRKLNFKEEFLILFFGLVRKYKGVNYLIDGFNGLPPDILKKSRLLIIGEIWDAKEEILKKARSTDIDSKITIRDEYVPDEVIPVYFSAADVVVLPYTRASQSGVAHIAAAFGKPVVISNVGGLKDSMAEYEGAFFIPSKESESISKVLSMLFERRPANYAIPKKTWRETASKYNELIEQVIG